ncbi:hypothetical protein HNR42_001871 [Deinobacterium chartae]|uniref:Tail specific protease domain-containing protein n=1 Tax=Deinobacterium chartae TaxID=521158 RepID=A0A841HYG6_9DEIO|nr:S41 family peptidase [Deinobacterium chartae]MBB6098437.1 hypothetical protein [Deinobacterium chartae]
MTATTELSTATEIRTLLEGIALEVEQRFVFPERAPELAARIRQIEADAYAGLVPRELSVRLSEELYRLSGDRHLYLRFDPDPPVNGSGDPAWAEARSAWNNHGVARAERLPGNVGLIELTEFSPLQLAAPVISAAFNLLARSRALIIDLRRNGGGHGDTVAFACGYLLREATHLITFEERGQKPQMSYSAAWVPGQRFLDRPVYVLTANRTGSAAEEFAYDLQGAGRATLVGERTSGAGHMCDFRHLPPHWALIVPTVRPVGAFTGDSWEAVGVQPDREVPAEQALEVAHCAALEGILADSGLSSRQREEVERALQGLGSPRSVE